MIRAIIERHYRSDKKADMERLLVELRLIAMRQPGYVSGETLSSVDDPSVCLIISTWADEDSWKGWMTSSARQQITSKIEPLLLSPEKVSAFRLVKQGLYTYLKVDENSRQA